MNRIQPIDGLRAFAVLGVIWAHVWMFFGNLPLSIAGVNIHQLLSFGGIGVDLFFVISGFCMYLMHSKKDGDFTPSGYWQFIKKRWLRIAPAFYFVVLVECLIYWTENNVFPVKSFLYHLFFINTFNNQNVLSPPFWSLATEWHFYLILPLLFISDPSRKYLFARVVSLMLICMLFRLSLYHSHDFRSEAAIASDRIWYRFVEFGFGILAARFYIQQRSLPDILKGNLGFLLSFLLAFTGRLLMTSAVLAHLGKMAFVIRALGEPVLAAGFALMIINLVYTESSFKKFISGRPFLFIGKISYSMYLWHWLIAYAISYRWMLHIGASALSQELVFIISVLCCIPVALISYGFLEAPYFKKRTKTAAAPVAGKLTEYPFILPSAKLPK